MTSRTQSDLKYTRFLRNYYLTSSLFDFIFAYAIYTLFFKLNGLSVYQISLLLAWWAFIAMIFEIPTGALADSWNRKYMLALAPIFKSICFITWYFAGNNIYMYGLGFVFWALGSSFVSGTSEALLYDTLNFYQKTNEYEIVLGKKKFFYFIALAISTISGGIIASYNIDIVLLLSIVPLILSFIFAALIIPTPKIELTHDVKYFDHIKSAFKEVWSNRKLLYLIIFLLSISIMGDLEEYDQLYYDLANLKIVYFGFVGFIGSILGGLSSYFAHRLKSHFFVYYFLPFITGLLLMLVGLFPCIPMIIILMLTYVIVSPLNVLIESKIQHTIKSISRATITSLSSLLICFFGVLTCIILGMISNHWKLQGIYIFTGIFLVISSIWVFFNRKSNWLTSYSEIIE